MMLKAFSSGSTAPCRATRRTVARKAVSAVRASPVARGRKSSVTVKAIFGLFGGAPKVDNTAKIAELKEQLVAVVGAGKKASVEDVQEVVSQLQPLGIKAPTRSKQFYGAYEVAWSSKPSSGTAPKQFVEEPDQIREVSTFKSLGLLTQTSTQSGELNGIDNNTYEETYTTLSVTQPLGGVDTRNINITRTVEILYLDADVKIVKITGDKEGPDGTLVIYERVVDDAEEEEDEAPKKQGTGFAFLGGNAPKEGTATIAERQVRQQMAAEAKAQKPGTQSVKAGTARVAAPAPARQGTQGVKAGTQGVNKAGDSPKEQIKELIEQLTNDYKEAQAEAREAAKEAKDLERANAGVLKKVAGARQQLKAAAEEISDIEEDIQKAQQARAAAEAAIKEAMAGVSAAQNRLKAAARK